MVNITTCEICGRVIPATEHGCAYCERERGHADLPETPYLPLAIRLLLVLLVVDALAVVVFATGSLWRAIQSPDRGSTVTIAVASARIALAVACAIGVLVRRPLGRTLCLAFIGFEVLGLLATVTRVLPRGSWAGAPLEPLWTCLFFFLFLRADVIRRYDPPAADRRELRSLIRVVEKGKRQ
jgi:hypothetical protein